MARLVRISDEDEERTPENRAHKRLAEVLPASWVITTNVLEHVFEGRKDKREIDCLLLTPLGFFILELKDWTGSMTPSTNGHWVRGDGKRIKNPFAQYRRQWQLLRGFLESRNLYPWIECLVVMTDQNGTIEWTRSRVGPELQQRVSYVADVETRIRRIAATNRTLDRIIARKILEALDPAEMPSDLFCEEDWREPDDNRRRQHLDVTRSNSPTAITPTQQVVNGDYEMVRNILNGRVVAQSRRHEVTNRESIKSLRSESAVLFGPQSTPAQRMREYADVFDKVMANRRKGVSKSISSLDSISQLETPEEGKSSVARQTEPARNVRRADVVRAQAIVFQNVLHRMKARSELTDSTIKQGEELSPVERKT